MLCLKDGRAHLHLEPCRMSVDHTCQSFLERFLATRTSLFVIHHTIQTSKNIPKSRSFRRVCVPAFLHQRLQFIRPLAAEWWSLATMHNTFIKHFAIQTFERLLSRVHLPQDNPKRIDIDGPVVRQTFRDLRRHIAQRTRLATHGVCFVAIYSRIFNQFCQAEVNNLDATVQSES